MIFFLITTIGFLCLNSQVIGQDLYLIHAHPYSNTDQHFDANLLRYYPDSLATVQQLAKAGEYSGGALEYVKSVKYYHEEKLITLFKSNEFDPGRRHKSEIQSTYLQIDIGGLPRISEYTLNASGRITKNYLVKAKGGASVFAEVYTSDNNPNLSYYLIDTDTFNVDVTDLKSKNNLVLVGEPGGEIEGADYLVVYSDTATGQLEIPLTGNRSERPVLPYVLPEKYWFKNYSRHVIEVINNYYFTIKGDKTVKEASLGSHMLIIYDKEKKQWLDKTLKGDIPRLRGFGRWLAGYVYNSPIGTKDLPGSKLWKEERRTGLSPAERFALNGPDVPYYAPGILYLYNPTIDSYIEWETNQADSEVVVVDNDQVIYRVYDQLYHAKILANNSLSRAKLLIKSDIVPDIHWAFFGASQN